MPIWFIVQSSELHTHTYIVYIYCGCMKQWTTSPPPSSLSGEMFVVHNFFRFCFLLSLFVALFSTALVTAHVSLRASRHCLNGCVLCYICVKHTHTHACTHTHTHARTHACTHTHTYARTHTHTHAHTQARRCTHTCSHIIIRMFVHADTNTYVHVQTHTHTHTHTNTCTYTPTSIIRFTHSPFCISSPSLPDLFFVSVYAVNITHDTDSAYTYYANFELKGMMQHMDAQEGSAVTAG